ncbi:MAG: phage tail protein, partial [Saprospiraceae bacterium]|nr:phage tail protein [Saprospiraceae bacterium]
ISLLNENHEPVVSWRIESAYPVRLSYSDLDAYGRGPLMETLEICCEGIRVVNE